MPQDLNESIHRTEAAQAIADMIGFGAKSGSHLEADKIRAFGMFIVLELRRQNPKMFDLGPGRKFKVTVEEYND